MSKVQIPNRAGMNAYKFTDDEYEDFTITAVTESGDWYDLRFDGMGIGMAKAYDGHSPHGIVPKVGDTLREYGKGLGYPVRGMAINGTIVFWHSPAEKEALNQEWLEQRHAEKLAEFEKNKGKLDAEYDALPAVFKQRIDRFRHNNPDFRWEYESYELFCCTEAMKLVRHLGTLEAMERYAALARSETFSANRPKWDAEWEEQKAIDRAADLSDGHSGNTHGCAVSLAFWFLKQPQAVAQMHGALAPLVGSWEYGDIPPDHAP